jgi:pimeloyl-ACP methyl ester carboxylesterase
LVCDEVGHGLASLEARLSSTWATRGGRLANQAAGAQIRQGVDLVDGNQTCDATAAHRHDDFGAVLDVLHVAAEAVVQLADADFGLQRFVMWRHNDLLYALHRPLPRLVTLVAGRERIYLDRFWNELSKDPKRFDEEKRQHYAALYAQPGAMRAGFAQFLAFSQDAADNRTFLAQGKLQMPVLAFGGEATFGPMIGAVMRCVADNVEDVIIPDCGHWITEEQPQATTDLVVDFLRRAR